ncbi:tetratricopeptide repeat-containing sensor histidine kinase [Maribacter cobaltidurans]|uniref:histidine kinase n=1 Tax=Maribacter cobaltidurans TaxID=1178778 RepID=A0A223VA86_9FLAO|nr:ATP-binding protein [Maribacter cobaltidurans]ASV32293.1 hypothetical protein CJ263_19845 [Maribacter cobaltidurans]
MKIFFLFAYILLSILSFQAILTKYPNNSVRSDQVMRDTVHILELNRKAEELRYKKSDSIRILALKALELSSEIDYEKGIFYSTYNLASHELYQGNTAKSLEYNLKAIKNPNLKLYPSIAIKIYNDIAQAHFIKAEHPKAYENFLMAKYLAEDTQNKTEIIRINSNLGTMFLLIGDYEESMAYYDKAREFIDEDTPNHIHGLILSNLGYLNMKKKALDIALDYLNQGSILAQKTDYSTIKAFNYLTLGEVYRLSEQYDNALEFYKKASTEYLENGDKKGTADLYFGLAMVHMELKEFTLAKEYAHKSLNLYSSFNLKTGLEKCSRLLYQIAKSENDINTSLVYLERAEAYSDSISKEQNRTNIAMLKAKLAFEEERKKLDQKNLTTINQQRNYISWSMCILVIAVSIIIIIYRSNKKRKQLNAVLADKTRNLLENERILNETNETKDKLFSIVGHDLRGPIISLKGLLEVSLKDINGESQFKRFGPKLHKDLEHIHFTLDNLLNWGQTQMQGASVNPVKIIVKKELEEIIGLFEENIKNKNINLLSSLDKSLCVMADLNHFRIIFRNLISNAIKFTHENGTIHIKGEITDNHTIIKVIDNGVGMSKVNINKIWDNKEHLSTFGTQSEKGTGLGLMLCKEMVEKNNGNIQLESEIDVGTSFFISLSKCP